MRRFLTLSLGLHALVFVVLGTWICPWLDRHRGSVLVTEAEAQTEVDLVDLVLSDETVHAAAPLSAVQKPQPAQPAPDSELSNAPPLQNSSDPTELPQASAEAPTSASTETDQGAQASLQWNEDPNALPGQRSSSVGDYLHWIRSHNESPPYPIDAQSRHEEGRVVIRLTIPQAGSPLQRAEVEISSGFPSLDNAALQAAQSWHCPPFRGSLAAVTATVPFQFSLQHP